MSEQAVSRGKLDPEEQVGSEWSVFARSGTEFQCLRGFRSTDTLLAEPIQSFTTKLLSDDWCHDVRCNVTRHSSRHRSTDGEANPPNF
jgi:hypothetical protein